MKFFSIGAESSINLDKVICILNSNTSQARRLIKNAKENGTLIDATRGKGTNSVILTETRVIISYNKADTLRKRFNDKEENN